MHRNTPRQAAEEIMDSRDVWEHNSEKNMQLALAGSTPREEYLLTRKQKAEYLVQLAGLDGTQRGFEVGSGEGIVARYLSPHCLSVDCTDISRTFLKKAEETCSGLGNVNFRLIGDDYLESLPQSYYDFGFSMNVFIHFNIYDIFHYLRTIQLVLKPGGLFYFSGATIGEKTVDLFRYFAAEYLKNPDPVKCRGYMTWNDAPMIRTVIEELDFVFLDEYFVNDGGHLDFVVKKAS